MTGGTPVVPGAALLLHVGDVHLSLWVFVALGAVAAVYYLSMGADRVARGAITRALGAASAGPVSVETVEMPVRRGRLALTGVRVEAPRGHPTAVVRVGRAEAEVTLASLLGEVVEVPRVVLSEVEVRLAEPPAGGPVPPPTGGAAPPAGGRRYLVREVRVTGAVVRSADGEATTVEEVRLADLGLAGGAGVPLDALAAELLGALLSAVGASGAPGARGRGTR